MSAGASKSGDIEDAPMLQSHAVDLCPPGSDVTGAPLSGNSRNLAPQRLCRVCLFLRRAGLCPREFFQLDLGA